MFLAGAYVNDDDLLALANKLRACGRTDCAEHFEWAYYRDVRSFDLSPEERDDVLVVLGGGCSPTLTPLRSALEAVAA